MSYDFSTIISDVKKHFKKENIESKVGTGEDLRELTDEDFIKLGPWWSEPTKLPGIPFGKLVTIGGSSDSGKTSLAIQSVKAAIEQGCAVIYCETENKTTEADFKSWGVDPSQILIVSSPIAEETYTILFEAWTAFRKTYPDVPLLVVIDSIGNLISLRDSELNMMDQSSQPGGKGKANRVGISRVVARMSQERTATLLISYTYDNLGSVGKTTAGGQALHFYSALMYQTSRKSWLERVEKGEKVRYGAEVLFKLQKNHLRKNNPGKKEIVFKITSDGISYVGGKDDVE